MAVLALIKGVQLNTPSTPEKWNSLSLEDEKLHCFFKGAKQSPIPHILVDSSKMNQSEHRNGPVCRQVDQSDGQEQEDVWQKMEPRRRSDQVQLSTEFNEKCRTRRANETERKYKQRLCSDSVIRSPVYKDANANERKVMPTRHSAAALPVALKASLFVTSPSISPESPIDPTKNVRFTFGSDSGSDTECNDISKHKPPAASLSPALKEAREARKGRFKKMLQPLRRSHSAASTKDIPAHALFLRNKESESVEHRPVKKSSSSESSSTQDFDDPEARKKKTSITKNVKQKLAFLRRRNTDSVLVQPSAEEVESWSRSFDNLLFDKYGLALFRGFLRTEFSEENIDFWIACEEYRSVVKAHKLANRAQHIYEQFVAVQSPREVNLDSKTRLATINNIANPDRDTFDIAQHRIQALMEKDSYPRFLRSDVYHNILKNNAPSS